MSDQDSIGSENSSEETENTQEKIQRVHNDTSSMSSTTSSSDEMEEFPGESQQQNESNSLPEKTPEDVVEDEDGINTTKDDEDENEKSNEDRKDDNEDGNDLDNFNKEDDDQEQEDEPMHVMERMELSEDEEEVADTGPTKIDLEMARCKANLGEEGPYFVKLPNFLSIDTKPFDAETYDDELEEDDSLDDEGRTRLKLKLENTIRWRTTKDEEGNEKRESNSRIVRWSDGSMSLYLGNEIFEVDKQRIMDFNHLYIRQGSALQAQSVFDEKLVFRPHSTETLTHRKVTMNMAEKTSKAQKVRMLANVGENPDDKKKELIRLEEDKLRAAARREAQQRRIRERPRAVGLTSGFLEGYESDEGTESIAAIKRRYQHAPYGANEREGSFSESDEEREERQQKSINEAKIDSEEEEMDVSDTEQRQKLSQHQKKKIVIEDDDDDED